MWDFGGGTYVPGSSPPPPPGYPPQQSTYPAYPQEPSPFSPLGQPMPQISPPGYDNPFLYDNSYPQQPSPPQQLSRGISEPAHPFAGATISRSPPGMIMQHSYSAQGVHTHTSHSHVHHHQHQNRLRRPSNAQAPPPQKLSHHPPAAKPHVANLAAAHAAHPHPHTQVWQYSKCTGRKKALCIGINYHGTPQELHGCINDAKNVRKFLVHHWGYKAEDIVLLTDDSSNPRSIPTRVNIIDAMRWLVKDSHPHDSLFFHYSGHGSQVKDLDGDEIDGRDEVIMPFDYRRAGHISDDLMHDLMVRPLPIGCRLTAVFDSCHSGSILDLPYLYHTDGREKRSQVTAKFREDKSTPADVISWSGCKDSQTSADTFEDGTAVGAMSFAFMSALRQNPHQTYQELLRSVRKILREKYSQKPQLSSSHRLDTNLQFIM